MQTLHISYCSYIQQFHFSQSSTCLFSLATLKNFSKVFESEISKDAVQISIRFNMNELIENFSLLKEPESSKRPVWPFNS